MNSVVLHKKTHDLLRATKRRYAFFDHEARAENGHLMRPDPEPQKNYAHTKSMGLGLLKMSLSSH